MKILKAKYITSLLSTDSKSDCRYDISFRIPHPSRVTVVASPVGTAAANSVANRVISVYDTHETGFRIFSYDGTGVDGQDARDVSFSFVAMS